MRLTARYGEPRPSGDDLLWKVPGGSLMLNGSRAVNPMQWSVVMWVPPDKPRH